MRVGHEHGEWDEDGNWKSFEPSFHNLVQYGKSAIRSADLFQKGDRFVAEGQVRTYEREVDGETVEEFVAKRIGHDSTRTNYTVDRNPRKPGINQEQGQAVGQRTAIPASNGAMNPPPTGQMRGLADDFGERPNQLTEPSPVVQLQDMYL